MRYANNREGDKIEATPNVEAYCPGCKSKLLPKCGSINIWHFAHKNTDCDTWYEPETKWHREWKDNYPKKWQEVVIGNHRADIVTDKNVVIELQNSSISKDEIVERERFYKKMIWILNGEKFRDNLWFSEKPTYRTFHWKHPRKCWWYATCPIYIDFGKDGIFEVKKIYNSLPCRGWGKQLTREDLLDRYDLQPYTKEIPWKKLTITRV